MRARRWSLSARDISVLNYSSVFASVDRLRFIFVLTVLINVISLAAFGNDHLLSFLRLSHSLSLLFSSQDAKWLLTIRRRACFTIAIQFPRSVQFDNGRIAKRYLRKHVQQRVMHLSNLAAREIDLSRSPLPTDTPSLMDAAMYRWCWPWHLNRRSTAVANLNCPHRYMVNL